jgi:excisionase family DNA binding protein
LEREDSFLTVAEVAEVLKLNQQTVRNWIDQGALPALRVGRRVRIRRADFERLLTEGFDGARSANQTASAGPSADDFWGGEPVGLAEPAPSAPQPAPSIPQPASNAPLPASNAPQPAPSADPQGESVPEFRTLGPAGPPRSDSNGM